MAETQSPDPVSTKLQRIAELAQRRSGEALTTLAHHIDVDFLREAFGAIRKDGAVGVDGQTAAEYAEKLEENLQSLLRRFKTGAYRAPPVRRVQIPKGKGRTRTLGIPTVEDKILQRAVAMVLGAVYEQDFLPCSYGFRPGRSAHQALQALWEETVRMGGGWLLEVDIQGFFDHLDHAHLRSFLDRRVRDGVLRRVVDKWLKAGVLGEGPQRRLLEGTPQGGVISPLLANLYLHVVLDEWMESVVRPRMRGRMVLIRYADDFVILFAQQEDAQRVRAVLPQRLAKYGLSLHPEKTRLVRFQRPQGRPKRDLAGRGTERPGPETFTFLGFTHYWGKSRKGRWVPKRKTSKESFARGLRNLSLWLRHHRHWPLDVQHRMLVKKLKGHYAYFGLTGNADSLSCFLHRVGGLWRTWLNRRSHRGQMPLQRYYRLLDRYPLPPIVVVHSVYRRAANP